MPDLHDYVVISDAVNLTTDEIDPNTKKPVVVRLVQGETIHAPEDHPSILNLLAQGGICLKSKAKELYASLAQRGTLHRPTVQRHTGMKGFRITAHGVSLMLADHGYEPPEKPAEDVPAVNLQPDESVDGFTTMMPVEPAPAPAA